MSTESYLGRSSSSAVPSDLLGLDWAETFDAGAFGDGLFPSKIDISDVGGAGEFACFCKRKCVTCECESESFEL